MRRLMPLVILLALCIPALSGCKQDLKNVWKDTRRYYHEYVNTPATLDFEPADAEPVEDRLATVYTPVGLALESFKRDMQNQDVFPTDEWVENMFKRYPWLSGISVVAPDGSVFMQKPEMSLKALDFAPLFVADERLNYRAMHGYAQDNPLGPEVYLGTPFFVDNEMKGMVIAHFDPRNLLSTCPDPARLVILGPKFVLWAGHYIIDTTPLVNQDWEKILKNTSTDTMKNDLGEFLWISKNLGNLTLVFAATSSEFPIDPSQLNVLSKPEPVVDVPTVQAAPAPETEAVESLVAPATPVQAPLEAGMMQPALNDSPGPAKPTKDYVWSVQIGAFHNPQYAQDRIELLKSFGYSPCLMKLYDKHGQLWHIVQIADSPDKVAAFKEVRAFRAKGTGLDYNVEVLDAGVVSRRKECF